MSEGLLMSGPPRKADPTKPKHKSRSDSSQRLVSQNIPGCQKRKWRVRFVCTGELRPHGQLDLAAARLHARKRLRQVRQPDFFGDEIACRNIPPAGGFDSVPK